MIYALWWWTCSARHGCQSYSGRGDELSWPRTILSDLLIDTIGGYWGEGVDESEVNVHVVRNGDLKDGCIDFSRAPLRGVTIKQFNRASLKQADLIITTSGDCGKVAYVDNVPLPSIASNFVKIIRVDESLIHSKFLYYFLISKEFLCQLPSFIRGTTMPNLLLPIMMDKVLVPTPPINEQIRISGILDKICDIYELANQVDNYKNVLSESIFVDIFGDPVLNPLKWNVVRLETVADIRSGVTKGRKFNGKTTVFSPYLRVANVQDGYFDLSEIKEVEVLPSDIQKFMLHQGDVLMTEGGDFDKLGRGSVWNCQIENCIHQNHIFRVRPNTDKILPEFLNAVTGSQRGKRYFLSSSKQTTGIASINKTQLSAFPMILPPIELQKQFVSSVQSIDKIFDLIGNGKTITEFLEEATLQSLIR